MRRLLAYAVVLALPGCARPAPTLTPAPDLGKHVSAERGAVTSASPYASAAGLEVLRQGGNAVDAAVATAFAVGVAEPQMSGVGGGGAALVWLQGERRAEYVDFYSAQPSEPFRTPATPARQDLRVVAVPGSVAGLLELHQRFGRLPREAVMAPAIRLAEEGFPVNQVLAGFISDDSAKLHRYPNALALAWPGGRPLPPGALLRNPELAAVLRRVAAQGRDGFYRGETAARVVAAMNAGGHPVRAEDFAAFPVRWKRPLCASYRGDVVLSAPPPQTGMQLIHTLKLLEHQDLAAAGLPTRSVRAFDLLASAIRTGAADGRGNDDPQWRAVPAVGMISDAFAAARRPLIGTARAAESIEGAAAAAFDTTAPPAACAPLAPYTGERPGTATATAPAGEAGAEGGETTHISVVDGEGNAVALTQTNSSTFGVGELVAGFFLNDSGFRFDTLNSTNTLGGIAWRTRTSTIAPTIVLRDGRVQLVVGSPGGGRIIPAIAQVMIYVLDYRLPALEAVRMPRIFPNAGNSRVEVEHGFAAATLQGAAAMGYAPGLPPGGYARVYLIARDGTRWTAVADPRHDGGAAGY